MAGETTSIGKITEVLDAVKKVAESVNGSEPPAELGESAVPAESPLVASAHRAKAAYQKTARWVLAAFAAVGVLIFGSLPFASLAGADLSLPGSLWLFGSLAVAALGIVMAVIAVSLVSEPEDASLGELAGQLAGVKKGRLIRLREWWNPRRRSRKALAELLSGNEAAAHLGPGMTSVNGLIKKMRELEELHATQAPDVAEHTVIVESKQKRVEELSSLLEELRKRRAELVEAKAADSKIAPVAQRVGHISRDYDLAIASLAAARNNLAERKRRLARTSDELARYDQHRTLVLVESSVMQMRGTFRLARRILGLAAVLTLIGGAGYAVTLPGTESGSGGSNTTAGYAVARPVTVTVKANTPSSASLDPTCIGPTLTGLWIAADSAPPRNGPFTIIVTDPPDCRGQLTVSKDEGSFDWS